MYTQSSISSVYTQHVFFLILDALKDGQSRSHCLSPSWKVNTLWVLTDSKRNAILYMILRTARNGFRIAMWVSVTAKTVTFICMISITNLNLLSNYAAEKQHTKIMVDKKTQWEIRVQNISGCSRNEGNKQTSSFSSTNAIAGIRKSVNGS